MSEAQIKKTGKREKLKEEERKNMMKFETFVKIIEKEIGKWLPESFKNADISIVKVKKTNDVERVGIMIRTDKNIAPNIYLKPFYDMYLYGRSIREIVEEITDLRVGLEQKNDVNTDELLDFEKWKNRVLPQLVSNKWNQEQLNLRPHVLIEDLAVVFYVHLQDEHEANMRITNEYLSLWKTTPEELYELALRNLANSKNGVFESMEKVIEEIMFHAIKKETSETPETSDYRLCQPSETDYMFILTNKNKVNGASELLDKRFMNSICDLLGCDFYILPSSIHECIIIPFTKEITVHALKRMVREVNKNEVAEDERLSDSIYTYSVDLGFKLA